MEKDKLIVKTLKSTQLPALSGDFQMQTMNRVFKLAEKKRRRAYQLNLALISSVSVLLIAACVYILRVYYSFRFVIPELHFTDASFSILLFSLYIVILILVLIGFDTLLRRKWRMRNQESN